MKRRVIASLLTLVLCLTLLPAPAFAADTGEDTPEPAATGIYVSITGNDDTGDGSEAKPYATLAKAVCGAGSGATIYVMSDLTMTKCARYYNKNLTITSYGETRTVTRGRGFETLSDTARSWYNPAMIEVQGNQEGAECGLTLTNIILDDGGKHEGDVFAQAISGKSEEDKDNLVYVQDAMIASNATVPCTITLGEGAILRNFGGMSAVRVTEKAKLVMESGSKIEDTTVTDRVKGPSGSVGPAGAIWVQGASVTMEKGSEISNIIGRAVYVDGGDVRIDGTITNIKADTDMWENVNGTVLHLRNSAIAEFSGVAEKCIGGALVITDKATFNMKKGALLGNSDAAGIKTNEDPKWSDVDKADFGTDRNIITINGEITGIQNSKHPIQFKYGTLTIGESGYVHDNAANYGALYIQRDAVVHIYGKINNNVSAGRGGALGMPGHGFVTLYMYPGAEMKNNRSAKTGGGASLNTCKFIMYGGEISGNTGKTGGGIYLASSASVDILGGTITSNTADIGSNDLTVTSSNWGTNSIYLYISDKALIGNPAVYMEKNTKTVSPVDRNIKLHNASGDSIDALSSASGAKGWSSPLATFWTQRDGAANLTVGGLKLNADQQGNTLPVYVLTQKTGEDGKPASSDAPIGIYAATVDADGNVMRFTLPAADVNGCGCAVAIVQPTQYFGTLTISGPETIKQNKTDADYPVAYTVTYVMSESLKNIITQAGGSAEYSLVITKDARLTGTPDSFDGNSIQVTYTLPNDAFAVGDSLFASAELTVTVGENRYVIPSNVTETKLLGLESSHVVFDWNDGSGKTETVSVTEGEALGDRMIADPARSGYTFTGWNTQQDGKGSSFDNSTVITGSRTVYAQWSENSSGGGGGSTTTYYYFAIEKVDAQDGHALNGAKFGLYLDGKQVATATSNRSGIALFRVSAGDYRKINAKSELYYQELTAPEGYVVSGGKTGMEKDDLTTNQAAAEKKAETVRNYRGSTPDLLNDADHFAYVIGYKDGNVRPYGLISRAETTTIFFRLLKDSVRDGNLLTSNTYTDVADDYWANTAISTMTGLGIVQGRSADTFDPKAPITRAQFAAICARFDTGKTSGTQTFTDIKGHWAEKYIERAAELGWIKGFEDGTFRPDTYITRAQAMTMINRVLNRIPEENSDLLPDMNVWPDCNPGDWFYLAVQEATNSHDFKHKAGNYETWTGMNKNPDWTRYEN